MTEQKMGPTLADIKSAAKRIFPYAHRTPTLTCAGLSEQAGCELFFKPENLQKVGAFKFRGACNAVFSLDETAASRGVITHSSGNHGAALALAARLRGIEATIVVPTNAPPVKLAAIKSYGATIVPCEPTVVSREATAKRVQTENGATFIHPYDNEVVIAGAGTAALELLTDRPDLDLVMAPVGGGGLLSGTSIASTELSRNVRVIAAEPAGADDACRSFRTGKLIPQTNPVTIADGLRTSLSPLTFGIIRERVTDIVTVSEEEIIETMRLVWERMKIVIEPSSAVPIAAVLNGKVPGAGSRIGIILSGGNVDLRNLPWQVK